MTDPAPEAPDTIAPTAGLGRRTARGAMVTLGGQAVRMTIQIGGVVVLAHLLSPHDYGLLAMVLTVVGVGDLFRDFGLSSAAIQATTLSRHQRDNLFWLNTGIGAVLALATFLAAPLIADLYDEPDLVGIARALSLTFLLNGLATQYRASLTRHMQFAKLALIDIAGPAVALAVAVLMAVNGAGYEALVVQQLTTAAVLLAGVVVVGRWLPGLPRRHVPMRGLLKFGWNLLGTQLVGYASNNVDSLTIGVRFGTVSLGLYNRAFSLLMQPLTQLRAPTTTVALPVLSRLRDDTVRFGEFVRRGQLALAYTLVAGLSLVIAAAEPLTQILLGPQWTGVIPLIRFLAAAGMFQTLAYVGYWVYLATGLTGVLLRYTLVSAAIRITCVVVGSTWGVVGVAAGYAVAPMLAWPLSLWWLSRHTPVPLRALLTGALRTLAAFGACAAVGWYASTLVDGRWPALLVALGASLAFFGLVWLAVPLIRRDVREVVDVVHLARSGGGPRKVPAAA
ncbi:lipopolysaccharide biosynthesis protein [Cellulomonas sp.]|uniref:lipopolysaccharide biosynthesis protein n=1 Tax=Cellulomonas sp. TaxID=40001 RepID=UPI0025BD713A|nr:lipopolysaccharide biosynthesis protein [Cellulomonas sp.]